ncbi:MAG TPA: hypothetical protein PKI82_08800 [Ruminococcus flavefaciens]|nr:hypothetical protein [Ruminococcus flavefaciens]
MKHRKIISAIATIGIASAACTMALGAFSADDITTAPAVTVYETTTEIVTTHPPYYTEIGPDVRKGTCSSGENIVWELSDDGTLTISGKVSFAIHRGRIISKMISKRSLSVKASQKYRFPLLLFHHRSVYSVDAVISKALCFQSHLSTSMVRHLLTAKSSAPLIFPRDLNI